ncbi:MAG: hypothetical protein SFX72_11170 [Isosphaeraceae bacterium]|nr:hypothetical protein [Isosphaeraceae bacterium]
MQPEKAERARPTVRLAFWSFFVRLFVIVLVLLELFLLGQLGKMGIPRRQKAGAFLFFSLHMIFYASAGAMIATAIATLVVHWVVRPVVLAWHRPPADGSDASFHLENREVAVESAPARMRRGRLWTVGTLVRTDRRLVFFPKAWDVEPVELPLDRIRSTRTEPAPRMFFGFVEGVPPRLVVVDADGAELVFTVAEPEAARARFCPRDSPLVSWIS